MALDTIIKLGVDHVNGVHVQNFEGATRNEAIRTKLYEEMGMEVGKFDPQIYEAGKHKGFAVIREVISQTISNQDDSKMSAFYNQFVEETHIEDGDVKEFEVDNDAYLTVGKVSGNNWDLERQRIDKGATFRVKTDAYYVKVYEYFKRFMTGRMDFAVLVAKVDEAIKKFKDDAVADAFKKAVEGLPSGWYYSGSYNEGEIQKVIDNVTAANDGASVTLVGTKGALNKLQGITAGDLSDAQKAEYNSNGYLRNWKGYACAELPTIFKKNSITEFAFDTKTVYVIPSGLKPIKMVVEGEPIVKEVDSIADNKDMTKDFAVIFRVGFNSLFNKIPGAVALS